MRQCQSRSTYSGVTKTGRCAVDDHP